MEKNTVIIYTIPTADVCAVYGSYITGYMCVLERICTYRKGRKQTEVQAMNERIARQIEEMKKQTIGVEVEMNNIRRIRQQSLQPHSFGTED